MFTSDAYTAKTLPVTDDSDLEAQNAPTTNGSQPIAAEAAEIPPLTEGGKVATNEIPASIRLGLTILGLRHFVERDYSGATFWPPAIALLFCGITSVANCIMFAVLLRKLIGSWAIGIAVSSLAELTMMLGLALTKAHVASPLFHELLRSPQSRKMLGKNFKQGAIGFTIPSLIVTPLIIVYAMLPMLSVEDEDADVFGSATQPIIWFAIVGTILWNIINPFLQSFQQLVPVEIAKFTTTLIETYMGKVRDVMLDTKESAVFERLAREQTKIEAWAHSINDGMSMWNGMNATLVMTWTAMPMVLLGLYAGSSTFGALGIGFLSIMQVFFFVNLIQVLQAVTLVNRNFVRQKIRVLNDARLVPVIDRSFRLRREFIEWLDTHEISATRAFGIRVTTKRMAEAVGVVGSLLLIGGTVIMQKQVGM